MEKEKNNAYREYILRKKENLPIPKNNAWFELFEYRKKHNKNILDGSDKKKVKNIMKKVKVMKKGKQVASSQNLEVILRYQRNNSSIKSAVQRGNDLHVKYDDGASVKTKFSDPSVLKEWIRRKKVRGVFPS